MFIFGHFSGVIYRDVNLKNILISASGNLAISDFGLAKWLSWRPPRGRTKTICGTLAFMAPEVAGGLWYDHSVDLWSLGVLLYCLAFAKYPFSNKANDHQQMSEILDSSNMEIRYETDKQVEEMMLNLLQFDPERRCFTLEHVDWQHENFLETANKP